MKLNSSDSSGKNQPCGLKGKKKKPTARHDVREPACVLLSPIIVSAKKKKNEFKKKRKKKDEDMANSSPVLHFFSFQQHHQSSSHSCNQTTLLIVCPKINLVTLTSEPLLYSKSTISVHQQTRHLFFFFFSFRWTTIICFKSKAVS